MQSRVHVLQGDITTIAVDVIVNAANSSLLGEVESMARFIVLPGLRCWRPANRLYNNRKNARPGMPLSRWLARFRQKQLFTP